MTVFNEIVLLPEELKVLKKLKNGRPHDFGKLESHSLFFNCLIAPTGKGYEVKITNQGRRYLIWMREDVFRHRWPVYLSIAAFVVSLISLVVSIIR